MLRLAFDFIIAWREIRARPNAYVWAVQPAYVGYINTTIPNRLLSCQIQVIIL